MLKYSPCLRQTLITHILLTLKPDGIRGVRAAIQKNNPFATAITAKVVFSLRQLPLPKNKLLSFAAVKQPPLPHSATEVIRILKNNHCEQSNSDNIPVIANIQECKSLLGRTPIIFQSLRGRRVKRGGRSNPIFNYGVKTRLLRRFAPRNDNVFIFLKRKSRYGQRDWGKTEFLWSCRWRVLCGF